MNDERKIAPLFLFSLPRSGSTLIQRILGAHEDIATVSEPWILLPHLYTLKKSGMYAEYNHIALTKAIEDLYSQLPNGIDDYLTEIREFVLRLYRKASKKNAGYFLDKTPRYHFISEEIIKLFPEGRFIFLWRNPLSIVASIMDTWGEGKWILYRFKADLFDGLANLVSCFEDHEARVLSLKYEDVLLNPETELGRVFNYLDLPFDSRVLSHFNKTRLRGRWGDKTGTNSYGYISDEPLQKWKRTIMNPARKAWCKYYLRWIGKGRLEVMGYDYNRALEELNNAPHSLRYLTSDFLRISYGVAYCGLELKMLTGKIRQLTSWHQMHSHR